MLGVSESLPLGAGGGMSRSVGRRAVLAAAGGTLLAACARATPLDVARIAIVAPLTGDRTRVGRDLRDAVHLALDEWNVASGTHGLRLDPVVVDDSSRVGLNRVMADPRVIGLIGGTALEAATTLSGYLERPGAPAAVLLTRTGRSVPTGVVELAPAAEQLIELVSAAIAFQYGPVPVVVMVSGVTDAVEHAKVFARDAKLRELTVRGVLTLAPLETDYPRIAAIGRNMAAAVAYVYGNGYDAGALWAALRPLDTRIRLVMGPDTFDDGFLRTSGGFLDGVLFTETSARPADVRSAAPFVRAFTSRTGRPPGVWAGRGYDAARLLFRAVSNVARTPYPHAEQVRSALGALSEFEGAVRQYGIKDGVPTRWKLALYRLDRDGAPSLLGEPEIQ